MALSLGNRRAVVFDVKDEYGDGGITIPKAELEAFEFLDLAYRSLCTILFNFVPTSGHPGGSISIGRSLHELLYNIEAYDLSRPDAPGADIIAFAAGHKALGIYADWALRNEIARIAAPSLLARDVKNQVRFEDLLGFRRNPTSDTPLFKKFESKALDGHPKPNVPFVPLATGASGVGVGASFGLALAAVDYYGADNAPMVHTMEGEGGMTPGRVVEALAMASAAGLKNVVMHVDFNQSSIDSDRVCRDGNIPGDYVQWTPAELFYLHDWNVITVPNGHSYGQIYAAHELRKRIDNSQPTAIIYRTTKGWRYGIEGRKSHGAGHAFCSDGFYTALKEFEDANKVKFPRFTGDASPVAVEGFYWENLLIVRRELEAHREHIDLLARKLENAAQRFKALDRRPRAGAPDISVVYDPARTDPLKPPAELQMKPGSKTTTRATLGTTLKHLNIASNGGFFIASADLLGSTSALTATEGFPQGYFHTKNNALSRTVSVGGICEDAMGAVLAGISTYGCHIGVGSSYAAFIAALQHIAARLHGIGSHGKASRTGQPYNPFIMIAGHAGYKTGEDGPTHADPQSLQLLQENFPPGITITLTPWDPLELWPLVTAALQARPALLAVFVTRPTEVVLNREALNLPPPEAAIKGVYAMRRAAPGAVRHGTLVLQESGAAYAFLQEVLPRLDKEKVNLNIFYVSSAELFDMLPPAEQESIFPQDLRKEAMAITGFTLPTVYRWVASEVGLRNSLHAFSCGHYPGSGQANQVMREVGLDCINQYDAVMRYVEAFPKKRV